LLFVILDILLKYFNNLSEEQIHQFSQLRDLYNFWNKKINVISRKDIGNLYEHHVLHSLSVAKIFTFKKNTLIADVGTGGGFPGIPLAIYFPDTRFIMIESKGKKAGVAASVAFEIGLDNFDVVLTRIEDYHEKYDFVLGRAVTSFCKFAGMTEKNIHDNSGKKAERGIIYLKGADCAEEKKMYKEKVIIYNIKDFFEENYFETKKIVYLKL